MPISEVIILGEKLTIKGDSPVEEVREISDYIDRSIKEIYSKNPSIPPKKALILALFNVAGELRRLKMDQENITKDICEKTNILAELFD